MLRFAWRWAEVGDRVVVHATDDPAQAPLAGVIAFVDRPDGVTMVGVRVGTNGDGHVIWPFRSDVHSDPADPGEHCIRCDGPYPINAQVSEA
ncbi:MAG: hypothetical protein ACRBK7_15515 [Acidimicrobiales bacterium]